jgi:5-methyltetrahydrofolate--homocysteine methyltransferase
VKIAHTTVSSATREVVIGFDRPFTIIGERINPTGRKLLAEEMKAGDFSRVERDAVAQVEAGAHMLDVNAGIPLADEPQILAKTVRLVQALVDVPLSIDSSIVDALEAGLAAYVGKPLVNSVTGEEERLERVLPLVKKYGAAVVAISNDDTGISEDPDVRFEVARRIVERAADHGIPREDVVVDPLVMPIGAMATAGQQVFRLVRRLREELGVNTTCGASNISFGMPDRERINAAYLPMAIASGLTSAITNPLSVEVKAAIMAADVLMGNDQDAARWIRAHREAAGAAATSARAASSVGGPAVEPVAVIASRDSVAAPVGNRPRINRRALAAAAAMRDASSGLSMNASNVSNGSNGSNESHGSTGSNESNGSNGSHP